MLCAPAGSGRRLACVRAPCLPSRESGESAGLAVKPAILRLRAQSAQPAGIPEHGIPPKIFIGSVRERDREQQPAGLSLPVESLDDGDRATGQRSRTEVNLAIAR